MIQNDHENHIINCLAKSGILGKQCRKDTCFREKFLQLPPELQQKKIRKWLQDEHYKIPVLHNCQKVEVLLKNLSLDDETIKFLDAMVESMEEGNYKFKLLNLACIQTIAENKKIIDISSLSGKIYLHKLAIKTKYYGERKKEINRSQQRLKLLKVLEQEELDFADLYNE